MTRTINPQSDGSFTRLYVEELEDRLPFSVAGPSLGGITEPVFGDADLLVVTSPAATAIETNEFTVGSWPDGIIPNVGATALSNGDEIVAFVGSLNGQTEILARRLRADRNSFGPTFVVDVLSNETQAVYQTEIVEQASGGYTIFWSDDAGIHRRRFDDQDQSMGQTVTISSSAMVGTMQAVCFPDGFAVFWEDISANTILYQAFDEAGSPVADVTDFLQLTDTSSTLVFRVTNHPTSDVAFAWTTFDTLSPTNELTLGTFDIGFGTSTEFVLNDMGEFLPTFSFAVAETGDFVVAGERTDQNGRVETFVQRRTSNGTIADEKVVSISESADSAPSLVSLSHDGYVMAFVKPDFAGQLGLFAMQLNPNLEPIANWKINDTPILDPHHYRLIARPDDGFSVLREGMTLNGNGGALVERSFRLNATNLQIAITPELMPSVQSIQIHGIPEEAGLNRGSRLTTLDEWSLAPAELTGLQLLSHEFIESFDADVILFEEPSGPPIAAAKMQIGSADSDRLIYDSADWVDGRDGNDQLQFDGLAADYVGDQAGESVLVKRTNGSVQTYVRSVEFLVFDDQIVDIDSFVDLFGDSNTPEESSGPPSGDPSSEDDEGASETNDQFFPFATVFAGSRVFLPVATSPQHRSEPLSAPLNHLPRMLHGESSGRPSGQSSRQLRSESVRSSVRAGRSPTSRSLGGDKLRDMVLATLESWSDEIAVSTDVDSDSQERTVAATDRQPKNAAIASRPMPANETVFEETNRELPGRPQSAAANTSVEAVVLSDDQASDVPSASKVVDVVKFPIAGTTVLASFNVQQQSDAFEESREQVLEAAEADSITVGAAVVVASGVSIAQLSWLLRGSVVMTKLLTSVPVWMSFDPLPVLANASTIVPSVASQESLLDIAQS